MRVWCKKMMLIWGKKLSIPSQWMGQSARERGATFCSYVWFPSELQKAAAAGGHLRGEQCPSLGLGEKTLNLEPWREMPHVCTWCLHHPCQGAWLGHGCCFVGILSKKLSEALHFGVFLTQIDPLRQLHRGDEGNGVGGSVCPSPWGLGCLPLPSQTFKARRAPAPAAPSPRPQAGHPATEGGKSQREEEKTVKNKAVGERGEDKGPQRPR